MPPDAIEPFFLDWKTAIPIPKLRSVAEPLMPIELDVPRKVPISHTAGPQRITPSAGQPGAPTFFQIRADAEQLEAKLFTNRVNLKLMTSQVAMHLSADERRSLFSGIDRLLDIAHWEDDSSQIDVEAFRSYLRFTIYARPRRLPNLGVSPDGALLASWRRDEQSVQAEFLRSDQCMTLIRSSSERGPETIVWRGHVARLRGFISNNGAIECIDEVRADGEEEVQPDRE